MAYNYSRSITVNSADCGSSGAQANFPVLVSITDTTFKTVGNGGHVQNSNGYDIGFYSDSGLTTALFWEIESYDAVNGILVAWVNLGTGASQVTSASNAVFYVGYGDATINSFQSTASSVWDSNYVAVYHFGNGSTLNVNDSTGVNNGSITGSVTATSGQIDGAASFPGSLGNYIQVADSASFNFSSFTLETWIKSTTTGSLQLIHDHLGSSSDLVMYINTDNTLHCACTIGTGQDVASGATVADSNPHQCIFVRDTANTVLHIYVDGSAVISPADLNSGSFNPNQDIYIGQRVAGGANFPFSGYIDEMRLSNIARSADWLLTGYNNQKTPGNIGSAAFLTYGNEPSSSVNVTIGIPPQGFSTNGSSMLIII